MRVRFSPRAAQDFHDILLYTTREWGVERSNRYEEDLDQALEKLAQFPHLGRPNQLFGPDARSLKVGRHIVVYRVQDDEILIARVYHGRQGPPTDIDE